MFCKHKSKLHMSSFLTSMILPFANETHHVRHWGSFSHSHNSNYLWIAKLLLEDQALAVILSTTRLTLSPQPMAEHSPPQSCEETRVYVSVFTHWWMKHHHEDGSVNYLYWHKYLWLENVLCYLNQKSRKSDIVVGGSLWHELIRGCHNKCFVDLQRLRIFYQMPKVLDLPCKTCMWMQSSVIHSDVNIRR